MPGPQKGLLGALWGVAFIVWCRWRGTRNQSRALAQSCDDLHDGLRRILPSCRGYCERCDSNTIPGTDNDAAFVRSTANGKHELSAIDFKLIDDAFKALLQSNPDPVTADKIKDLRNMFHDAYTGWIEIDEAA